MEDALDDPTAIAGIRQLNDSVWELHCPEGSEMDIVFFHGLQAFGDLRDAVWKTWLVRDSKYKIWPKEWLPSKFPKARILSVSYIDSARKSDGQLDVYELRKNLISDIIMSNLNIGQEDRAVILVGHSLGGIIIKQLVMSAWFLQKEFINNVRGVFFYSTPHHRSRLADFLERLPSARPLVKLLKTLDADTARINGAFRWLCENLNVKVAAVGESLNTRSTGSSWLAWLAPGSIRVVEEASARFEIDTYSTIEDADHFTVCKAKSADSLVVTKLTELISNALRIHEAQTADKVPEDIAKLPSAPSHSSNKQGDKSKEGHSRSQKITNNPRANAMVSGVDKQAYSLVNTLKEINLISTERARHRQGTAHAEALIRKIQEGGEDGYYVSSKWLLRLENQQMYSLMSIISRAGYSEIYQTATTTLFAKLENDVKYGNTDNSAFPENSVRPDIADPDNALKIGSSIYHRRRSSETEIPHAIGGLDGSLLSSVPGWLESDAGRDKTKCSEPGRDKTKCSEPGWDKTKCSEPGRDKTKCSEPGWDKTKCSEPDTRPDKIDTRALGDSILAKEQPARWTSLKVALKSNRHQSFFFGKQWLSNLEDGEREALIAIVFEAGYEKSYETSTTTWYESICHHVGNQANDGRNSDPSTSSHKTDAAAGDLRKPGTSGSAALLELRKLNIDEDTTCGSFGLANTMETSQIEDEKESTCRPQLLTVTCSSLSLADSEQLTTTVESFKEQKKFGDLVVTMPRKGRSKRISTTVDRSFSRPFIDFPSNGRGQEVFAGLKAIATTSLNCCLSSDHHSPKVRIKLSKIYGQIENTDSKVPPRNAMVLSTLCTNLQGFILRTDDEDDCEEIALLLEEEYYRPPQRRVLKNSQQLERGQATTSDDLEWLAISDVIPKGCHGESITLELRGDVKGRRKVDLQTQVQRANTLHFQDPRPVVFEGNIDVDLLHPTSYLIFHIRYQLEVSYYKPCTPLLKDDDPVWKAESTREIIEFDCRLKIRSENIVIQP